MKLFFRVFLLIQLVTLPLRAQYMVQGVVTDSLTKEPLPYTSVYLKGTTEGGMTDNNGRFSFKTYRPEATLVISAVGYNEYVRLIHPAKSSKFNIALSPATYALDEVVVKPKRERYKKKDNPTVEFVRKMIEHRDDYSPDERDFWKRDRYEKMTFAINNFDSLKQQKWLYRKFKFLTDYVDTSAVTGRPVLAISNRELLATDYYRKSPHSRKQWVTARRQAGVDEMLSQQGMEQAISVTMTDVDLYENNITLFTNKFVSPLSSLGPSFYKYYLMDTLTVAGKPCVDLTFVPFNSESFGFTGHLYVMLDSTYFVKRAVMNFPQKINLNFVDYMKIEQNFDRAEDGTRQLLNESITTEFKLVDNSDGIYAKRDVYYRNYQYEPDDKALQAFRKPEKVIEETSASGYSEAYWDAQPPGGGQQERDFGGQDDGPVAQLSRLFLDGESVEGAVHGVYSRSEGKRTFVLYRYDEYHYQRKYIGRGALACRRYDDGMAQSAFVRQGLYGIRFSRPSCKGTRRTGIFFS